MKESSFVIKGDICYSASQYQLDCTPNGYLVCVEGVSCGVFTQLPERYAPLPLLDYSGHLVLPGLVDLHLHAPQFSFRGLGMDLELLEWLKQHTFPEESKFADLEYAERAYTTFVGALQGDFTTRCALFATLHTPATLLLMEKLEKSGLISYVGKVNMDRNAPSTLQESGAELAALDTIRWVQASARFQRTRPILTPRFIPTCSDELMQRLAEIQQERALPLQSHLSENRGEIEWVRELCPQCRHYADAYDRFGLFGGDVPTIMAHCVWCSEAELQLMREKGVYIAHCPQSNQNLASGIAPLRTFLDRGIRVGLGSDMAGGCHLSIFRAMTDAIQVSKLYWRLIDSTLQPLSFEEAFYLGTAGGGSFFGQVGRFEAGYELDALVIRDGDYAPPFELTLPQRVERTLYVAETRHLIDKFVAGKQVTPNGGRML